MAMNRKSGPTIPWSGLEEDMATVESEARFGANNGTRA